MTIAKSSRRTLGAVLLLIGVLVLIVGGAYMVRSQAQGAAVREELRAAEPAAAASTATPEQVAVALPRATATPRAVLTKAATAAPTATRSATRATASARPAATSTATAVPPTVPAVLEATGREPVRLVFADLKIDTPVIPMGWQVVETKNGPVSEWVIPKKEAGRHINSASLGESGNLVISGHNNIYGQVFKPISLAWDNDTRQKVDDFTDQSALLNGRRIELYDAAGERYDYVVREFYRLKDTGVSQAQRVANGRFILPTEDDRLTIVTCWPPTNNTHRLILIAEPAP